MSYLLNEVTVFLNEYYSLLLSYFNTEFWSLVVYTGVITAAAFALGFFFPVLRAFGGAVVLSLAAMWYGYHKGQQSMEKKPVPKKVEKKKK